MRSARAFAPATVANVAVGFDLLGFAVAGAGDEATVTIREESRAVEIREITGVVSELPKDPARNTATLGLQRMIEELGLEHGFTVSIKKGIPLSSGMGGSAASAVAAVVAANALLERPLPREKLLSYALMGESAASGAIHGDNVAPCLYGGLTLALPTDGPGHLMRVIELPVPENILCVLVHPHMKIETREARSILRPELSLRDSIRQSACLAGFLAGCYENNPALIREFMKDLIIEPQRAHLIPGFNELKAQALDLGALGFSISGAGPSVFAWVQGKDAALQIESALVETFQAHGLSSDHWISPILRQGARI